jgi:hypothetical protein
MEKSHYQARTSFFRNTRHGGGQTRSNALVELFNWFYRRQLQRLIANVETTNEEESTLHSEAELNDEDTIL